jgi:hypothetical protein
VRDGQKTFTWDDGEKVKDELSKPAFSPRQRRSARCMSRTRASLSSQKNSPSISAGPPTPTVGHRVRCGTDATSSPVSLRPTTLAP